MHVLQSWSRILVAIVCCAMAASCSQIEDRPTESFRVRMTQSKLVMLKEALRMYCTDCGSFPPSSQDVSSWLMTAPSSCTNWQGPYLKYPEVDAWQNPFWCVNSNGQCRIVSIGRDRVMGTGDDLAITVSTDEDGGIGVTHQRAGVNRGAAVTPPQTTNRAVGVMRRTDR